MNRRAVYLATVFLMLVAPAALVSVSMIAATGVVNTEHLYQGGDLGTNGYSAVALSIAVNPRGACTAGGGLGSTNAGTVTLVLSSAGIGGTCTSGNFAEEFVVSFSATIAIQTNAFTITTQVGAGAVTTNSESVTVGTGSSSAFTQTVDVFVDYGAMNPPAGGITVLDLVVQ